MTMESDGYYMYIDKEVYEDWRAIGLLECLSADEDIARFLLTLYTQHKQKSGEEGMVRCVHCHSPLTLYCSTCHCPSHLSLPTQPPSPSLSCPPPALPPQVLDTSGTLSVTSDDPHPHDTPHLHSQTSDCDINEEEDGDSSSPQVEGLDFDNDLGKVECAASACDGDSRSTEPAHPVHSPPASATSKCNTTRQSCRRKPGKDSGLGINSINTRSSTRKHQLTNAHLQSAQKKRKNDHSEEEVKTKKNRDNYLQHLTKKSTGSRLQHNSEEKLNKGTQELLNEMQRKRKPCASQDLEKAHILPVEERCSAEVSVCNQSSIDHHKQDEDSPVGASRSEKEHMQQIPIVKNVPRKRGLQKSTDCTVLPVANTKPSSGEEDRVDFESSLAHAKVTSQTAQNISDGHGPLADKGQMNQQPGEEEKSTPDQCRDQTEGPKDPALNHILSSPTTESPAQNRRGQTKKQPAQILVAAQPQQPAQILVAAQPQPYQILFLVPTTRILPLRTSPGNLNNVQSPGCSFETSDFSRSTFKKQKDTCVALEPPSLQCEFCGILLKSQKGLIFHTAAHTNNRPFKCTLCDKSFVFESMLKSHIRDRHSEDGKRFQCDKCSFRSFEAKDLRVHQKCVHSNERPFKCTHCPSAFARKAYLKIHVRTHTGEKPYRCTKCLQTFAQRPSLNRHIRVHHQGDSSISKDRQSVH